MIFIRKSIINKKGIAMMELLACAALIVLMLYAVVLLQNTAMNQVPRVRNTKLAADGYGLMMYDLYTDAKSAREVELVSPIEIKMQQDVGAVTYVFEKNELSRNGKKIANILNGSFQYIDKRLTMSFNLEDCGMISYSLDIMDMEVEN